MSLSSLSRRNPFHFGSYVEEKNQSDIRFFQEGNPYKIFASWINLGFRYQIEHPEDVCRVILYLYWWINKWKSCDRCFSWPEFQEFLPLNGIQRRSSFFHNKILMIIFISYCLWLDQTDNKIINEDVIESPFATFRRYFWIEEIFEREFSEQNCPIAEIQQSIKNIRVLLHSGPWHWEKSNFWATRVLKNAYDDVKILLFREGFWNQHRPDRSPVRRKGADWGTEKQ